MCTSCTPRSSSPGREADEEDEVGTGRTQPLPCNPGLTWKPVAELRTHRAVATLTALLIIFVCISAVRTMENGKSSGERKAACCLSLASFLSPLRSCLHDLLSLARSLTRSLTLPLSFALSLSLSCYRCIGLTVDTRRKRRSPGSVSSQQSPDQSDLVQRAKVRQSRRAGKEG